MREQKCYIYCPICSTELISTNSIVSDKEDDVRYKCVKCGCKSSWNFDTAPVPLLVKHQKFTNHLAPHVTNGKVIVQAQENEVRTFEKEIWGGKVKIEVELEKGADLREGHWESLCKDAEQLHIFYNKSRLVNGEEIMLSVGNGPRKGIVGYVCDKYVTVTLNEEEHLYARSECPIYEEGLGYWTGWGKPLVCYPM